MPEKTFTYFSISVYRHPFHTGSLRYCVCACVAQLPSTCAARRSVQMKEFPPRTDSKSVCLTNSQHMLDSICVCVSGCECVCVTWSARNSLNEPMTVCSVLTHYGVPV